MSNVCCNEFKGWLKSFTKTERALAVLEAILLVVFLVLLVLFILHLLVCAQGGVDSRPRVTTATPPQNNTQPQTHPSIEKRGQSQRIVRVNKTTTTQDNNANTQPTSAKKCSWTPSVKTTALTHYYEGHVDKSNTIEEVLPTNKNYKSIHIASSFLTAFDPYEQELDVTSAGYPGLIEEVIQSNEADDIEAEEEFQRHILALVKLKPPSQVIFGCILTIVSDFWTLTAASCIEAIEEVDSLDSFVIMERYGVGDGGPLRAVRDVRIHPLYGGGNRSYDLAALRSAESLVEGGCAAVRLASMLDYTLTAIGDRYDILGYGPFRTAGGGRGLRRARVWRLAARACGAGAAGALRHLQAGRAAGAARCAGGGALCAGAAARRGVCAYCAGAPLLRGAALHALMADNPHCGLSCEPALYVNLAARARWIRDLDREPA